MADCFFYDSAVIKTAPSEDMKWLYERELHAYGFPDIATSPHIRKLIDVVGQEQPLESDGIKQELRSGNSLPVEPETGSEAELEIGSNPMLEIQSEPKLGDRLNILPEDQLKSESHPATELKLETITKPEPECVLTPELESELTSESESVARPELASVSKPGLKTLSEPKPDPVGKPESESLEFVSMPGVRFILKHEPDCVSKQDSETVVEQEPEPDCMVFEWMDYELRHVPPMNHRSGSNLPRLVAKSILGAIVDLSKTLKAVHTGKAIVPLIQRLLTSWQTSTLIIYWSLIPMARIRL